MSDTIATGGRARVRHIDPMPTRRVLIVANQTATSPQLIAELHTRTRDHALSLHLVVPALNTRLRHWLSDTDDAMLAAHRRAVEARSLLRAHGLHISVEVGDSVPLLAIEDALAQFDADEIVICTLAPERSHWLEHDLVESARGRFGIPVEHVVGATPAAAVA